MTGPIFFVVMIVAITVLPAIAGWSLSQKQGHGIRMAATLMAGQMIITPTIAFMVFARDRAQDENPVKTVMMYAAMALVASIMTFAIREMIRMQKQK